MRARAVVLTLHDDRTAGRTGRSATATTSRRRRAGGKTGAAAAAAAAVEAKPHGRECIDAVARMLCFCLLGAAHSACESPLAPRSAAHKNGRGHLKAASSPDALNALTRVPSAAGRAGATEAAHAAWLCRCAPALSCTQRHGRPAFARGGAEQPAPQDLREGARYAPRRAVARASAFAHMRLVLQEHHAQPLRHLVFNTMDADKGNLFATVAHNQASGAAASCVCAQQP